VPLSKDERVRLKGLYQVTYEREDSAGLGDVNAAVHARLHEARNICEDFLPVAELAEEKIVLQGTIEVGEVDDINELMVELLYIVADYVSPRINFYTLKEMLAKGYRIDEVMDGPLLNQGFIDTAELRQYDKHTQLYASDVIRDIMDIEGVLAVQNLLISSANDADEWVVNLDPDKAPRVDVLATLDQISFVRDNLPARVNKQIVYSKFRRRQEAERFRIIPEKDQTVLVERETELDLDAYDSIQNQFPINYGISEFGLQDSASNKRKAQALQLKSYLLFFEQLLANYFAQLKHTKELFSFWNNDERTYFYQDLLNSVPDIDKVMIDEDGYKAALTELSEQPDTAQERKNRFLNHLMARFSEQFTDYSLLLYGIVAADEDQAQLSAEEAEAQLREANSQLIADKLAFLRDYPNLSSGRGKSFNYQLPAWGNDNVPGLQQRIARMVGIRDFSRRHLHQSLEEGFHVVEHLLLRPRTDDAIFKDQFLIFSWPIQQITGGKLAGHLRIESKDHTVQEGEFVELHQTTNYNGCFEVTEVDANGFEVDANLDYKGTEAGVWTRYRFKDDPYSLQLSFVFPSYIGRFEQATYREFIEKIIRRETPAHITVYTLWMDEDRFTRFEVAWQQFLENVKIL